MATEIRTNLNPDIYPSIADFRDFAFFIDGDNIPFYANENGSWDWMHLDPTATPSIALGAGSMNGVYQYMFTEYNRDSGDGDMHSGHETNPSPVGTSASMSNQKATLTLPSTGVNGFTTHLKIYSTDSGGSLFYYIGNVEIGTTSFEDDNIVRDTTVPFGKLTNNSDGTTTQTYLNYSVKDMAYNLATKTRLMVFGSRPKTDGTVAVTNGSATVTGTSTLWTRGLVGSFFVVEGDTRQYQISAVASQTSLTIDANYEGTTDSGLNYVIQPNDSVFYWSALHPTSAKPMWWAFPVDFYRFIREGDDSGFQGGGLIGNQPVLFKRKTHYLLSENGDDWAVQRARTRVGTASHWSIVETGDIGTLLFISDEGLLYETTGLEAKDRNVDLSKTRYGINKQRLSLSQACWFAEKKWYLLLYSSEGSTEHDKILLYDYDLQQWVILSIRANAIAVIQDDETGTRSFKPWIGTRGGFVYKLFTGDTFGAEIEGVTNGTLSGTTTAVGTATITDSSAAFITDGDGYKDVYVSLFDTNGDFQEEQKVSSNTATVITVDTDWTSSPQVGWTYEVGSIRWYWKSKVFDMDTNRSKTIQSVLLNFKKLATSQTVSVKMFYSEDPDMPTTATQTINFDLSKDYYDPLGATDNRARYFQYEISGHGVIGPATISNILVNVRERAR
jgi:hypothetical protein